MLGGHASDPPPYRRLPRHLRRPARRPLVPIAVDWIEETQDEETLQTFREERVPGPVAAAR